MSLNPRQFPPTLYHGTRSEFAPGDRLHPAAHTGNANTGQPNLSGVFASSDIAESAKYGWGVDNPRVYEVSPVDVSTVQKTESQTGSEYASKDGFHVVREVTPPEGGWYKQFGEDDHGFRKRVRTAK